MSTVTASANHVCHTVPCHATPYAHQSLRDHLAFCVTLHTSVRCVQAVRYSEESRTKRIGL